MKKRNCHAADYGRCYSWGTCVSAEAQENETWNIWEGKGSQLESVVFRIVIFPTHLMMVIFSQV